MKGAVELARTAIREFDSHIRNAWKRELVRLEHDGDAVGLVMMQECSPDMLYDDSWDDSWDERMVGMIANACSSQSLKEKSDMRRRVKDLLCDILGKQWVEARRNELASARRALRNEFHVPDGELSASEMSELAGIEKIDLDAQLRFRIATNLLRRFEMRKRKWMT